jgi:hypothetical protein
LTLLEQQLQETKSHESQLKGYNKVSPYSCTTALDFLNVLVQNLREELRKVQQSAALLEKQRNPGVGYWTNKDQSAVTSRVSVSSASSETDPQAPQPSKEEEEVNLEYLRNVILQFLEHKEMRVCFERLFTVNEAVVTAYLASSRESFIHHIALHASGDS